MRRLTIVPLLCLFNAYAQTAPIPEYSVTVCEPASRGYYFFGVVRPFEKASTFKPTHFVIDSLGNTVYFKKFPPKRRTVDFKLHANGLMSYFDVDKFYLMDHTFTVVDSIWVKNGLAKDEHELLILPNGNYVLLGVEEVTMDLSQFKYFNKKNTRGSATAKVKCGVIQEQDKNKNVVFEWRSNDYFSFKDVDPFYLSDSADVDWTHCNAIEYDADGNYLLSTRYFNEITKISRKNGSIIWRLGGKQNQFRFLNDPQKFIGQHDMRRLKNGDLSLYDNGRAGNTLHPATAKEYKLNEETLTAELVWSYIDNQAATSIIAGSVQRIENGNTVIGYGTSFQSNTVFNVVTTQGGKVFEMVFKDSASSYRVSNVRMALKIKRPVIKSAKKNGSICLDAGSGYSAYLWSTGDSTQTITVNKPGRYAVYVPTNSGGFISSPLYTVSNAALKAQPVKTVSK